MCKPAPEVTRADIDKEATMETVKVTVPKERLPMELKVKTAYPLGNDSARISTDTVKIEDLESGAMSINGYEFLTALFGAGLNIRVSGGDTIDPALYINGELALEGCGIALILETLMEVLKLECATQGEYPS